MQAALGLTQRAGEDRFLISVACLTLLSELAERRPVLCLVDDAQWLDTSSADARRFVARRLSAEGIVMLFAARDCEAHRFEAREIPELEVGTLDDEAATALIGSGVAPAVRDLLVEQSGGNALALIELPGGLSPLQLAGLEPLTDGLPLTPNVERLFAIESAVSRSRRSRCFRSSPPRAAAGSRRCCERPLRWESTPTRSSSPRGPAW